MPEGFQARSSSLQHLLKSWPESVEDALEMQQRMRRHVRLDNRVSSLSTIAGIDVGYDMARDLSRAVVAVLDYTTLELQQSVIAYHPTRFPYIPGFLSFREIPAIIAAFSCLKTWPDVLMVDGQGIAHPRRLGIAAHLGAMLDWPTLGVAKSRLTGRFTAPGTEQNAASLLTDKKETIGAVLRSKAKCLPLFISPGHGMDYNQALEITRHCLRGYRLPEPTRIADKLSKHEK
jgi:deoxyribonuclease V